MRYHEGIFAKGSFPICDVEMEDHILLSNGKFVDVVCIVQVIGEFESFNSAQNLSDSSYTFFISQNGSDSIVISKKITDIPSDTMVVCWQSEF